MRYESRCIGCGRCAAVCPSGAVRAGAGFDRSLCTACGRCAAVCPSEAIMLCGNTMTSREVFGAVLRDKRYYGKEGGVTLSGGECLTRPQFCAGLFRLCRTEGINTAVESALFVPWKSAEIVLPFCDLFIADLKIDDSALHRKFTGAPNARIKKNLLRLFEYSARNKSPKIWVRTPLIPGMTDTKENLDAIEEYLGPWRGLIEKRELLEYNSFGDSKKSALE